MNIRAPGVMKSCLGPTPGINPSPYSWRYSLPLMARKTRPSNAAAVNIHLASVVRSHARASAPIATSKLEVSSTPVLTEPATRLSRWLVAANAAGSKVLSANSPITTAPNSIASLARNTTMPKRSASR